MNAPTVSKATISDVARAAGVSPTTVSHALNGRGQVDARTRERVEKAALALRYRPNRHAQRLRTGEAHMIVLLSSMPFAVAGGSSRLGFLMEIAAVAAASALTRGLALVLAPPMENGSLPLDALDIDGALVVEPSARDPNLEHMKKRGLAVVTIGRQPGARSPVPYVDLRSSATARLLLDHLWAQGARRIALLVGAERRNSYLETEAVYRSVAAERAMPPIVASADEAAGEAGGKAATLELLRRHPEIDGICAPVDAFAVGAVDALREAGRRVPEDVVIATRYDGMRARTSEPALTAVDLHLDRVAHEAIELLLEHLRGDKTRKVVEGPEPELICRASTARR
ncbi:MAG: LacI family DNA-binding transcriptional regulator [Pseudomonadota bacterium]|nr:LacI family DNA-binding transcriptional regulator [Pseudomonadota bacterium]